MEVSGQFYTWPLYPWEESSRYPLDRKLGGLQSWSECCEVIAALNELSTTPGRCMEE
jgi:hypothetical protein